MYASRSGGERHVDTVVDEDVPAGLFARDQLMNQFVDRSTIRPRAAHVESQRVATCFQ
jgi:hypothetical protein